MVKISTQQQIDTDFSQYHLHVETVDVVNKSGNQYEGLAVVRSAKGVDHNVPVEVTADGDRVLWHTDPGAFACGPRMVLNNRPTESARRPDHPLGYCHGGRVHELERAGV
jgi:hypothetical protein